MNTIPQYTGPMYMRIRAPSLASAHESDQGNHGMRLPAWRCALSCDVTINFTRPTGRIATSITQPTQVLNRG